MLDRVHRTPTRLEQIQTYLSSLEMYIWMADGRDKCDSRRLVRISIRDYDVEFPKTIYWHYQNMYSRLKKSRCITLVCRACDTFEDGRPVSQFFVVDRTEVE